ncbi:MAG: glycosyltransferase family 4 protein [Candidatus Cloacimonetes bacterium]|nr:glycosyltransferase family 4 protein [Candidatus Cloacimonadota bacterium]
MKIAQITPYFLPHTGGVERYVYNLSKSLVDNGHSVEVFTSNIPERNTIDVIDGIFVRRLPCIGEPLRNPIFPSIFFHIGNLKQFDIIHVHNAYSSAALIAPLLKIFCDTPLILTHHGRLIYGEPVRDTWVKIYKKSMKKRILNSFDLSVALSESDARYISSFGVHTNKIKILQNAIDPADFSEYVNIDTTDFDKKYHLKGKKKVLFVGEVTCRKGIDTLMKSLALMIRAKGLRMDVIFVIVGSGENLSDAKTLAHDLDLESHVVFTGRLPFFELMQAYRSADLFVLPSLSEGLPTTILEAMYFGLPVVSTTIPGVCDHFDDVAMLVPPRDEHALAGAICELLENRTLSKRLAREGRELVMSRYVWNHVADMYEGLYEKLVGVGTLEQRDGSYMSPLDK